MGNCGKKIQTGFNNIFNQQPNNANGKIGQPMNCPRCNKHFSGSTTYNTLNAHLDQCLNGQNIQHQEQDIDGQSNLSNVHQQLNNSIQMNNIQIEQNITISNKSNFIWVKTFSNAEKTSWKWEKLPEKPTELSVLKNTTPEQAKQLDFSQKQQWFRYHLERLRIPWQMGCDKIKIHKDNVLMTSLESIKMCHMHKELKIEIEGDKVNDAGGLLREWVYLIAKEIFDFNLGIFQIAETEDIYAALLMTMSKKIF